MHMGVFKNKKIINTVITTLQVLLVIAMFAINELSMKRMGFMRYVVFMTHKIEANYPVDLISSITIGILVVMYFIAFIYLSKIKKRNQLDKKVIQKLAIGVLFTLIYVVFTGLSSPERILSYYFIRLILFIVAFLQGILTILNMKIA